MPMWSMWQLRLAPDMVIFSSAPQLSAGLPTHSSCGVQTVYNATVQGANKVFPQLTLYQVKMELNSTSLLNAKSYYATVQAAFASPYRPTASMNSPEVMVGPLAAVAVQLARPRMSHPQILAPARAGALRHFKCCSGHSDLSPQLSACCSAVGVVSARYMVMITGFCVCKGAWG